MVGQNLQYKTITHSSTQIEHHWQSIILILWHLLLGHVQKNVHCNLRNTLFFVPLMHSVWVPYNCDFYRNWCGQLSSALQVLFLSTVFLCQVTCMYKVVQIWPGLIQSESVPVIFEPPCTLLSLHNNLWILYEHNVIFYTAGQPLHL
jgi:hypothetical protein